MNSVKQLVFALYRVRSILDNSLSPFTCNLSLTLKNAYFKMFYIDICIFFFDLRPPIGREETVVADDVLAAARGTWKKVQKNVIYRFSQA